MKVAFYSVKEYDRELFGEYSAEYEFLFLKNHLRQETAGLAEGYDAVCVFVNDELTRPVLEQLSECGVKLVALRCAGFNNVDIVAAKELGIAVTRVPAYSPNAVAEHAVAMLLTLNRKTHRAYNRVREGNFELNGLLGFDLVGKTVGVYGTGKIGLLFAKIMKGFGCEVIVYDPFPSDEAKQYRLVDQESLFSESDIVSLHCPLMKETYHLYDEETFAKSKKGFTLINTGRGGLVDARAAIEALKSGQLGYLAMDVYEEEKDYFFDDQSSGIIQDDVLMRLMTFHNVLITGHQGFFTREALGGIVETTVENLRAFEAGKELVNAVLPVDV
ncbi:2-hydroxyacid dehydrogenase [Rubritalea spongiae]|uniref:2-hydroxyacid dehydrogenase n=1 Tax=Rubritalea spongiae TaxID=430797 RepID=A0ABW5DZ18_9BACT